MTVLKNQNQAVTSRMAMRSLKSNRGRSITMILAVLLSAFMIFSVFTVGMTFLKMQRIQNIRMYGDDSDAILYGITDEQREKCESDPDIEAVGIIGVAGYVEATPYDSTPGVSFLWVDETYWNDMMKPAREWMKGKYPTEEDEIMVTEKSLEKCGYEGLGIGDTITVTYGLMGNTSEKTLRICGMWGGYGTKSTFWVSEKFYEQSGCQLSEVFSGRMYLDFRQTIMTQKEQDAFIDSMNLGKQQNLFFTVDLGASVQILTGMIGIVLVTCMCAYLLIYNIMYLSVAGNIRYYGLLQTIGMTGRQIYRLMHRQMLIFGGIGIAGGLALGSAVSFFLVPCVVESLGIRTKSAGKISVAFHPAVFVLAILLTGITVWIAGRKPVRMAVSSSPIEALGYRPASGVKKSRKTGRGGVIGRMAREHLARNKKKSAVVMLSLAMGMSVFLCMATLIRSQGAREYIYNYQDLDMVLENDTVKKEKLEDHIQIMDSAMIQKLREITGVKAVYPVIYTEVTVPWEPDFADQWMREFYEMWMYIPYEDDLEEYQQYPENFGSSLVGITKEDFEVLNETLEEPIDEQAFLEGRTCIIYRNSLDFKNSDVAGKDVTCAQYGHPENTRTFEVASLTDETYYNSLQGYPPTMIVSDKVVKEFVEEPVIHKAGIRYDKEYDETTEKVVLAVLEESPHAKDFSYESKIELMEEVKRAQGGMMEVGIGIVLILALIGVMNYVNTSVGSIQSRQVELSVMESIGMTGRQIRRMLITEGVLYAAGAAAITLTAGLAVTYGIYQSMNYRGAEFEISLLPVLAMFVLVLLVSILVPVISYHNLEKQASVALRIRGFE